MDNIRWQAVDPLGNEIQIVIILATFIANLFFSVNIMLLVAIDGIIGFFLMRDKKYE